MRSEAGFESIFPLHPEEPSHAGLRVLEPHDRMLVDPESAPKVSDDRSKWVKVMTECLASVERERATSPCPVVDHELIASLAGSPDGMFVWCICRTDEEKRLFQDTEQSRFLAALKKRMIEAGFPGSAVTSVQTRVVSQEEVEAGGGRFYFFR
jgi:hypothetical protein